MAAADDDEDRQDKVHRRQHRQRMAVKSTSGRATRKRKIRIVKRSVEDVADDTGGDQRLCRINIDLARQPFGDAQLAMIIEEADERLVVTVRATQMKRFW